MIEDKESRELTDLMETYCQSKGWSLGRCLAFLSLQFTGTLAMNGYEENILDKIFIKMRDNFKGQKEFFENIRDKSE